MGKGVWFGGGSNLTLNLSVLTSADFNIFADSTATAFTNIFLNGYGAELTWTYSGPTPFLSALIGPVQSVAAASGAIAIRPLQPTIANGCAGVRGQGAADFQTDCTLNIQGATGTDAFVGSGQGNIASGNAAAVVGGTGNTASGTNGFVGGAGAADNGRVATNCWSSSSKGLSQTCVETLVGLTKGGTAVRLTANGSATAASTNTFNIPDKSAFSLQVTLTAIDISSQALNTYTATWTALNLIRGSGASTTALNGILGTSSTLIAPSASYYSGGRFPTPPGPPGLAADSANGGLNVTFTPPSSGDTWHVAARIESTEVK